VSGRVGWDVIWRLSSRGFQRSLTIRGSPRHGLGRGPAGHALGSELLLEVARQLVHAQAVVAHAVRVKVDAALGFASGVGGFGC